MTQPSITIPPAQFSDILSKAIIDSLEPATKETIIQGALNYLMSNPQKDTYGRETGVSPIQYAFNDAVRKLANEVAAEVVQEARPKIAEHLRHLLDGLDYDGDDIDLSRRLMGTIINYMSEKKNSYEIESWRS